MLISSQKEKKKKKRTHTYIEDLGIDGVARFTKGGGLAAMKFDCCKLVVCRLKFH